MNTTHHSEPDARLAAALVEPDSSTRLRAALTAGTQAAAGLVDVLVARCAVEPDFFVRDMLTWALCRLPVEITLPKLLAEMDSERPQARSQALHTLSKIGDGRAWPQVAALLHDRHDDVALSAWRAAAVLVPPDAEQDLAVELACELGRGDRTVQLGLSRALAGLGSAAETVLATAAESPDPHVRAHAEATEQLRRDPDSGFALSVEVAKRVAATGPDR
ncbi:HEAT repeat domain-containing protein [Nocardia veterana]|uniref:HEAT repeat domain-containing protein n=1 Tax=Nocardia veterana TaxID=132249 RepID=A0A7X6M1A3_9NOCA|nr:HEAT repeat domain-containing protein [Nocardia veterana]NKY88352.1 HEAT repeat domain-containing protein [Nocardia veterana]